MRTDLDDARQTLLKAIKDFGDLREEEGRGMQGHRRLRTAFRKVEVAADAYALAVLHEAVIKMTGDPGWHKGHTSETCPLAVETALCERLCCEPSTHQPGDPNLQAV